MLELNYFATLSLWWWLALAGSSTTLCIAVDSQHILLFSCILAMANNHNGRMCVGVGTHQLDLTESVMDGSSGSSTILCYAMDSQHILLSLVYRGWITQWKE